MWSSFCQTKFGTLIVYQCDTLGINEGKSAFQQTSWTMCGRGHTLSAAWCRMPDGEMPRGAGSGDSAMERNPPLVSERARSLSSSEIWLSGRERITQTLSFLQRGEGVWDPAERHGVMTRPGREAGSHTSSPWEPQLHTQTHTRKARTNTQIHTYACTMHASTHVTKLQDDLEITPIQQHHVIWANL